MAEPDCSIISAPVPDLPAWRCHKVVHAMKIRDRIPLYADQTPIADRWTLSDGRVVDMPIAVLARGTPEVGDYFVQYDDGYQSWSPAAPFEAGYVQFDERAEQANPVATAVLAAARVAVLQYEKNWPPGHKYARVREIARLMASEGGYDPDMAVATAPGGMFVPGPKGSYCLTANIVPAWAMWVDLVAPVVDHLMRPAP